MATQSIFGMFMIQYGGSILAFLGVALAALMAGIGSARGTGMVGEAATGLLSEDPSHFSKCLILQVVPGTQGLYGLVIAFFALVQMGIFAGTDLLTITLGGGMRVFISCLPVAFACWRSAIYQGRVAAASINMVSKVPNDWSKGMILCITVEFYAILSLLISFLMLLNVKPFV